ncbi:hypothetical protein NUU61_008913 [Penicillium alfredii]|uniref:Complex 1 LYR protein domain-containing protein n=1 Tax=Penicillium alfredii TaxID=1506179 RepID=A0A9W9EMC0_9EURO|nr:uncharacterized protein NUU61_008913 [Penicillium alfredii]KAJ5084334.1 hypothetical protein NUU61_008913 [Penicillium alfredii]
MARLSGLQREVLSLYRQCLREIRKKPVRSVSKKDFGAVEYLLRKGHRQLEMYASPGIRNIR